MSTPVAEFYPVGLEPAVAPIPGEVGGLIFQRRPVTPESLSSLARALRERWADFRSLPTREVIRGLAGVHARWAETGSVWREEAVARVHAATGYAPAAIDEALQRQFAGMDAARLSAWLAGSGIPLEALDAGWEGAHALGPLLTVVVASGNVPGAALPSVVQSLLLKSPCLVKTASGEPILLPLYARSIAEEAPELARALAVTGWAGGSVELESALLPEVEALIVYGGSEAVRSLRGRLPSRARFIGYGHRRSFSAIGREWLADEETARATAERAALDLCVFDQQGCYSPQTLFVEQGGGVSPERFGGLLGEALEVLAVRLPRHPLSPAEAAAIHQFRAAMEMRSLGGGVRLWTSPGGTQWTVVLDPGAGPAPGALNRTAVLRPLADLDDLPDLLAGEREHVMAAALGVPADRYARLAPRLAAAGVVRVTSPGNAQMPADSLRHDGVNAIATLVRWAVVE